MANNIPRNQKQRTTPSMEGEERKRERKEGEEVEGQGEKQR